MTDSNYWVIHCIRYSTFQPNSRLCYYTERQRIVDMKNLTVYWEGQTLCRPPLSKYWGDMSPYPPPESPPMFTCGDLASPASNSLYLIVLKCAPGFHISSHICIPFVLSKQSWMDIVCSKIWQLLFSLRKLHFFSSCMLQYLWWLIDWLFSHSAERQTMKHLVTRLQQHLKLY